ncbi:hypothetical protein [Arcticibacter sp. MXS-1]|uniref:hypothetical protein n=1 Tax=Arcticibacter sp. MXS-1 TaxID=3341726 RepID=UPI0035A93889
MRRLLIFFLFLFLSAGLEAKGIMPPAESKSGVVAEPGYSFESSDHGPSSRYFLQAGPVIILACVETAKGPFYRVFLFLCIFLAIAIRLHYLKGRNISLQSVLTVVAFLILYPFHFFP